MAGWTSLKWLINDEISQRREEGCCVDGFDKLLGEAGEDRDALMNVYEKLLALVPSSEFAYKEPDEYEEIKALSDGNIPSVKRQRRGEGQILRRMARKMCGMRSRKAI